MTEKNYGCSIWEPWNTKKEIRNFLFLDLIEENKRRNLKDNQKRDLGKRIREIFVRRFTKFIRFIRFDRAFGAFIRGERLAKPIEYYYYHHY